MFWRKKRKKIDMEAEGVNNIINNSSNKIATALLLELNKHSKRNEFNKEEINEIVMLAFSKLVMTLKKQGLLENVNVEREDPLDNKENYFG